MNKIKFIIATIIIFIVFVFIGETYIWHIDSFETEYEYVTFYLQNNTTQEEMINDIYYAAEKENVEVFIVDYNIEDEFSEKISIYCTDNVQSYLFEKSNIQPGHFESILLGNVDVEFLKFSEIPDISSVHEYKVIGNDADIVKFKQALIDKYGGKFPQKGYISFSKLVFPIIYLHAKGSLSITNPNNKYAYIIWPAVLGESEFGIRIQEYDEEADEMVAYEIMIDENGEAIYSDDNEMINDNKDEISQLIDKAKNKWGDF